MEHKVLEEKVVVNKRRINKVLITLIIVLAIGIVGAMGYVGYDYHFGSRDLTFVHGVIENYGMSFYDLKTVLFPRKDTNVHSHYQYLTDTDAGIYVKGDKFLYPVELNPNYQIKDIDFTALRATESPEIIGYIEFENHNIISYPVFYRAGSDYYLTHTRTGAQTVAAEIYVEGQIAGGHSPTNTIIYGHNMRNRTMFGSLREYKKAEYFPGHEFFWYYTPEGKYRYQIFSVYETLYTSDTFTWFAGPSPEYTAWLDKMNAQTYYDTGIKANPTDEVITLCTCTSKGGNYRLILQARLIYKDEVR